jgi:hypothetical protein
MPLQGLMLILFMIIIIPILIIFSNHDVFFILISFVLLYASLKNIITKIVDFKTSNSEPEEDLSEEFEQTMNVNVQKFKKGVFVTKNLIIILFLIYCSFFISDFLLKTIMSIVLTIRIVDTFKALNTIKSEASSAVLDRIKAVYPIFIDLLTAAIIVIVSINKYFNFVL